MPALAMAPAAPRSTRTLSRARVHALSRVLIAAIVLVSLGTLFWTPPSAGWYALDVLFRAWVAFLGTVMAHEGVHGNLGRTKRANFAWGRLALVPTLVPFTNFAKTHHLHHLHTNEPDQDPDHFMATDRAWELPFRALAMPHQWIFWLARRGRIHRKDVVDLGLNYTLILAVYALLVVLVGPARVLSGVGPVLVLVSLLLWYPFAFKTHEGFSTGPEEERSHSYYGRFMYWFSLGLSMHREHHLQPSLPWIELRRFVRPSPERSWRRWLPARDVRTPGSAR